MCLVSLNSITPSIKNIKFTGVTVPIFEMADMFSYDLKKTHTKTKETMTLHQSS